MKTVNRLPFLLFITMGIALLTTSCSKKNEPTATVNLETTTYKSGDVKGNGGSTMRTWKFTNTGTTAGWDMSIDARGGSFQLILKDAAGTVMLDKTLTAGPGIQSADGTTPAGTAGEWTATATLSNFNGSGDYSFR